MYSSDDEKVEVDENGKKEELSSGEVQIGAGEKEEDEEEEDNEEASDDNQEVTSDSVVPLVAVLAGQSAGGTTPTHHYGKNCLTTTAVIGQQCIGIQTITDYFSLRSYVISYAVDI